MQLPRRLGAAPSVALCGSFGGSVRLPGGCRGRDRAAGPDAGGPPWQWAAGGAAADFRGPVLGKVRLVLANPRLARVHPTSESNIPAEVSTFADGRGIG